MCVDLLQKSGQLDLQGSDEADRKPASAAAAAAAAAASDSAADGSSTYFCVEFLNEFRQ